MLVARKLHEAELGMQPGYSSLSLELKESIYDRKFSGCRMAGATPRAVLLARETNASKATRRSVRVERTLERENTMAQKPKSWPEWRATPICSEWARRPLYQSSHFWPSKIATGL